jgi:hypothetical protein
MLAALLLVLAQKDPIRVSFVVTGCNRLAEKPWETVRATNSSSANLPQLNRTLQDISDMKVRPWAFFFVGDMVLNLIHDDGTALRGQLKGWAEVIKGSPIQGKVEMIPTTGNHEMLWKYEQNGVKIEHVNPPCDTVWNAWLDQNPEFARYAGNGPKAGQGDVIDDQSRMSYSFDRDGEHFIVLNSDTLSNAKDPKSGEAPIGWVPMAWLQADVDKADANPAVHDIFIFAHRPIVKMQPDDVGSSVAPELVPKMMSLVQGSKKFRAYMCAHIHAWEARELAPGKWQIVAGNGGSKLEDYWQPKEGTFFGFTEVRVYKSGRVSMIDYRRPTPPGKQKYYEDTPVAPPAATPSPEKTLYKG